MNSPIDVKLLGPLEVVGANGEVHFEGADQQRLFVVLALRAPEPVAAGVLVQAVWGDGGDEGLEEQISRLGAHLPVSRSDAGYALEIERECIDSHRFESLTRAAR